MVTKYCLCTVLAVCAISYAADPQVAWEQALQAKGGRERLRGVQSLAIYMKPAEVRLAGAPANWLCVFPDRYFEWEGRRGMQHSVIVNAATDRVAVDANGRPRAAWKLTPFERDRLTLNQILYLLETAWLQPEPVSVKPSNLNKSLVLRGRGGARLFELSLR